MVTNIADRNPLDPAALQERNAIDGNNQRTSPAHNLNDLDMIIDRNPAPSPRAMCAELAHQHAMEDLHNATEHIVENDAAKNAVSARRYSDRGTQCDDPRKPEE
ncbi:hypothetical protein N7492_000700 [Penicillium capsulatum]|uniref:Uncharacterized protein n=1 Tax=Penicillium capsulatum TaxID=69766 RepID=A0A9W9LZN2_9EURO|nr:hypothetical protein N7492_000700 [Penicillium capsulatum]